MEPATLAVNFDFSCTPNPPGGHTYIGGTTMTNQERIEHLQTALRLLTEVRDSLVTQTERCPCCGFEKYTDWNERQARDQLNGAITRCIRVAERITNSA
jgi:hypothetical protein